MDSIFYQDMFEQQNRIDRIAAGLNEEEFVLLESQLADSGSSQKSYIAARPLRSLKGTGRQMVLEENGKTIRFDEDPWSAVKKFRSQKKSWLFGFLGYDLKNHTENLKSENPDLTGTPDFYLMEPSLLVCIRNGDAEILKGSFEKNDNIPAEKPGSLSGIRPLISRQEYLERVEEIKEMIREGDYYELNYSFPIEGSYSGDPYWLYRQMRQINPVPFASYIHTRHFSVCCASPERFLRKSGSSILSQPIKGTSARSDNPEEDQQLRELLMNEKNRAENLMIVDLVRHDLSKVAITGSVKVTELYDVHSFDTVHQLISSVEAEVTPDRDPVDIIRACFPMGSMTGAPKIRVMKAIEELEMYRRGIYSGTIGYFTPKGDFDFNVVIRSAIINKNNLIYPVGGAITSDSDPESEWEETEIKSRNLTKVFSKKQIKKK